MSYFSVIAAARLHRSRSKWLWCELTLGPSSYETLPQTRLHFLNFLHSPQVALPAGDWVSKHLKTFCIQTSFSSLSTSEPCAVAPFPDPSANFAVGSWSMLGLSHYWVIVQASPESQIHYQLLFTHQLADSRFPVVLCPLSCSLNLWVVVSKQPLYCH